MCLLSPRKLVSVRSHASPEWVEGRRKKKKKRKEICFYKRFDKIATSPFQAFLLSSRKKRSPAPPPSPRHAFYVSPTFPFSSFFPLQLPDAFADAPSMRFCAAHARATGIALPTRQLWFYWFYFPHPLVRRIGAMGGKKSSGSPFPLPASPTGAPSPRLALPIQPPATT